jgi:DNA recombination protein RmuC
MDMANILLFLLLLLVGATFVVALIAVLRRGEARAKDLAALHAATNEQFKALREEMSTVRQQLSEGMSNVSTQVQAFGAVSEQLGELKEATGRLFDIGKNISSLQEILGSPKIRGGMGEVMLSKLLAEVLPPDFYDLQYIFAGTNERVDAIIRLEGRMVPIDAKFPLENFRKMLQATDEKEKISSRKQFLRDVKGHIDNIASKYIRPDQGTYDFAMMYIPAENVYYQAVISEDALVGDETLIAYAATRHVILVSPNSFYAYLLVVVQGLRGLEIERTAQDILARLTALQGEFGKVQSALNTLGGHIGHAYNKFQEVSNLADRFEGKLSDTARLSPVSTVGMIEGGESGQGAPSPM